MVHHESNQEYEEQIQRNRGLGICAEIQEEATEMGKYGYKRRTTGDLKERQAQSLILNFKPLSKRAFSHTLLIVLSIRVTRSAPSTCTYPFFVISFAAPNSMPILWVVPWRNQFFQNVKCADDVVVPTKDFHIWPMYPNHRWIYDKLAVALSQGLQAAPHGVPPTSYPVFSKPIMNLRGMGAGSMVIPDEATHLANLQPGHFWSTLLTGEHVSSDAAVVDGTVVWWRHTTGISAGEGSFDYWHIHAKPMPEIESYCSAWSEKHLAGYTGMANFETIGGRIIEAHLRLTDQWPDLYGKGWLDAVIRLYGEERWVFDDSDCKEGFSVILFTQHGRQRYPHPSVESMAAVLAEPGVVSVQIPFHANHDTSKYSMPPGGFRLAIINATSLEAGFRARDMLSEAFGLDKEQ